jgi:N-methylhydantoinase A
VPVEFINIRVAVRAPVSGAALGDATAGALHGAPSTDDASRAVKGARQAYFRESGGFVETTVYDRARLAPGHEVRGPAVVEEEGSTLVIGPGGVARVAASGNLVVALPPPGGRA